MKERRIQDMTTRDVLMGRIGEWYAGLDRFSCTPMSRRSLGGSYCKEA